MRLPRSGAAVFLWAGSFSNISLSDWFSLHNACVYYNACVY